MNCVEYRDWVAADVDGALGAEEGRIRAHLESCPACRTLRAGQQEIRAMLRLRPLGHQAPFGLRTRILAGIDEVAAAAVPVSLYARLSRSTALLIAGLAALAVLRAPQGDALDPVIEQYYAALRGEMALSIRTASAGELERFYEQHAPAVSSAHVVDLEGAGFRLLGATVREVDGRPHRFTIYSDGQNLVLCDYRRAADDAGGILPDGTPRVFSRAGLTFCVRRMGDEICILVTRMPMHVAVSRLLGWA